MNERTVLFVDDEQQILRCLKRGLLDEPYNALFASSGKETLEILRQNQVHVLVSDMLMPEMTGFELLKIVKKKYPHIVRMVLSGYTQVDTVLATINQGEIYRFITKPWSLQEYFIPAIHDAIDYYERCNNSEAGVLRPPNLAELEATRNGHTDCEAITGKA